MDSSTATTLAGVLLNKIWRPLKTIVFQGSFLSGKVSGRSVRRNGVLVRMLTISVRKTAISVRIIAISVVIT